MQDRGSCGASGVGEGPRLGNGSLDAERRGLDFDFLRGGVVCFGFFSSEDDWLGSSSSYIPGMFGGRAIRNWGEVGVVLIFKTGRRARGEGGVGGVSTTGLML